MSINPDYLIDPILPAHEVSLAAGSSGAGKTTLLLQWLRDWSAGLKILDFPVQPIPFAYYSLDRSQKNINKLARKVGLSVDNLHSIRKIRNPKIANVISLVDPSCRLLVIEGMARLVPNGDLNDYNTVADFLTECGDFCEDRNLTMIGVVHSPKQKIKEGYAVARDKILGSVAWSAYSETIIHLESFIPPNFEGPPELCPHRQLTILPREQGNLVFQATFNTDGLLDVTPWISPSMEKYFAFAAEIPAGVEIPTNDLVDLIDEHLGLKRTVAFASVIPLMVQLRLIESTKHGMYKRKVP